MKSKLIFFSLISAGLLSSCGGTQSVDRDRSHQVKTEALNQGQSTGTKSQGSETPKDYEVIEIDLGDSDLPLSMDSENGENQVYFNGRDLPPGHYLLSLDDTKGLSLNLTGIQQSNNIISLKIAEDGSATIQEAIEISTIPTAGMNLTHDGVHGSHGAGSYIPGSHISAGYRSAAYGTIGDTVSYKGTTVPGGFFKGSTVISAFDKKNVSVNHGFNYFIGGTLSKSAQAGFAQDFKTQIGSSYYSAMGAPDHLLSNISATSEISPFKAASISNSFTIAAQNGWLSNPLLFDAKNGGLTAEGNKQFIAQLSKAEPKWKGGSMLRINGRIKFVPSTGR